MSDAERGTDYSTRAVPLFPVLAGRNVGAAKLAGDSLRRSNASRGRDRAETDARRNPAVGLRIEYSDMATF
jgi:hypothetical protein